MIKYFDAPDIRMKIVDIKNKLGMSHVDMEKVACLRSRGSGTRNILARCHGLSKIMQLAMKTEAHYAIEVISERFDILPEDEQIKTLIHELMHIPKNFGGGFRQHDFVKRQNVEVLYKKLKEMEKFGRNNFF
jgi:predicted metallopeptidase